MKIARFLTTFFILLGISAIPRLCAAELDALSMDQSHSQNLGSAPNNFIWKPILGDHQVNRSQVGSYDLGTYKSIFFSLLFGNILDRQMLADYGAGIGTVSNSPQAMYKRFDVYDADCECMRSMLKRIQ